MESTFAERLWWARQRARMGATLLARKVGCSQGLISALERNNASGTKFNNKFADALKVDRSWLAHGDDPQPKDFDAKAVREARAKFAAGDEPIQAIGNFRMRTPRWMNDEPGASSGEVQISDVGLLWARLVPQIMELRRQIGPVKLKVLLDGIDALDVEEVKGKHKVGA